MTSAPSRAWSIRTCCGSISWWPGCRKRISCAAYAPRARAMAELVGVFAASHGPMIVRNWEKLTAAEQGSLDGAFAELGRRITAARADALVVISPDHWVNFFIDNLPSICVGVGEVHGGPPEPWFKAFPHRSLAGHPALAQHIVRTALDRDFEPSISYQLVLDHGFCLPLWKARVEPLPAIVP